MLKRIIMRYAGAIVTLVSIVGMISPGTTCHYIVHQPDTPEELR